MTNKQKVKGTTFERDMTKMLNELVEDSTWKRVPGSGAIGTIVKEPFLTGDINGRVISIEKTFKAEAKVGYGGATQFALKKEWLDKIREEADGAYAIPLLLGKFSGSRGGVKSFVVLEPEVFAYLLNKITELSNEVASLMEEQEVHSLD